MRNPLFSLAAELAPRWHSLPPISAALALILVFEGVLVGLDEQLRTVPSELPTPLVALQAGASNLIGGRSTLAQEVRQEVEAISGVAAAHPLVSLPVIYTKEGLSTPICIIGYDTLGGPRSLSDGRGITGGRELVVDAALARKYGLSVGDDVAMLNERFTIVGLSSGTTTMFAPYVFVKYDDLVDVYLSGAFESGLEPPLLSFLLVAVQADADERRVRAAIEASVPRVDLLTPMELAQHDVALGRRLIGPIVRLMIGIAWLVGLLVVGLTTYTAVHARLREYGVMKAIGARDRRLIGQLVVATLVLTLCALGLALLCAEALAFFVHGLAPQYLVVPLAPPVIVRAALASAVIAVLGALLPMRTIARVEPALVFRS